MRDSASNARRCTIVVTVAADGTKLPPFFIFKGEKGGIIANQIKDLGIFGAQKKAWFDEDISQEWIKQILFPYITKNKMPSLLMVDLYKVHTMASFFGTCASIGCDVEYIPAGYTCVLQPVDVGFNSPFKKYIKDQHQTWCVEKYTSLPSGGKLPLPTKENIIEWVNVAYHSVKAESITKTFHSIGFHCSGSNNDTNNIDNDIQNTIEGSEAEHTISQRDLWLRAPEQFYTNEYEQYEQSVTSSLSIENS